MAEGEFIFEDSATIEATFVMDVTEADHNALFNRDIPDQHPISAITGLQDALNTTNNAIATERNRAEGVEGSLSNLTTENKTNLVSAINEVDSHTDTNASNLANHIANKSNPHEVTKAQVGLGNVDNTSDLDKPISTATQTALNGKQDNLTTAQLNAVNSGINSTLVGQISTNQTDISTINGKIPSDASSSNQLADKSYVDTADGGLQTQITVNAGDIDTIEGKIPSAASSSNQLADKNFVNSSISTNTANFIGTFNSVAELEAYSGTLTNNDYAFVIVTDSLGNTAYDRYKYTTATTPASWLFEYELNNSSFTADQWAAINSGATSTNIGQIATNTSAISGLSTSKQDKIDSTHKLDSDLVDDSGQTNKFVTSAEKAQISTNASDIAALQSGKADKATTLSGYGITDAYTKTEVDTALNNKADKSTTYTKTEVDTIASGKQDNLTTEQLNAVNSGITSAKVTQYDGYSTNKANVGLDNLNANGQMIIDSQNGSISNCILEIPQNIKLTLENGLLTVKSGSELALCKNSTYTTRTLTQDYSRQFITSGWGTNKQVILWYWGSNGLNLSNFSMSKISSGATTPESLTNKNDLFFNTTDFTIYQWYNGSMNNTNYNYPLCILENDNGTIKFVKDSKGRDMIFNGAGFIGHHAFVYPNVKGLYPNGFNVDGTLKSGVAQTNALYIREMATGQDYTGYNRRFSLNGNGQVGIWRAYKEIDNLSEGDSRTYFRNYVKNENLIYNGTGNGYNRNSGDVECTPFIEFYYDGTTVTKFDIRQPYEGARNLLTDDIEEEVATKQVDVTTLTGYDSTKTQTLKNINGVLTWVTD